jgi:hypothetical protein
MADTIKPDKPENPLELQFSHGYLPQNHRQRVNAFQLHFQVRYLLHRLYYFFH